MTRAIIVLCTLLCVAASSCIFENVSKCPDEYSADDAACAWYFCRENPRDPRCLMDGSNPVGACCDASDIDACCDAAAAVDGGDADDGGEVDACCNMDGGSDAEPDGQVRCTKDSECTDRDRSHCDLAEGHCVACESKAHCGLFDDAPVCEPNIGCVACNHGDPGACAGSTPACLSGGNECVQCNVDMDCTADPGKARCDTARHECVPCDSNVQCAHMGDKNVCNAGVCVECTPATEAMDCGDNACDPDTFECTDIRRNSLASCRACRSDSECINDRKCIRVPFMGEAGEYHCMQVAPAAAECPLPFQGPQLTASSKNGAPAAAYCAHNTNVTTCEAVNALTSNKTCTVETVAEDCGRGARCEPQPSVLKCTYSCSSDRTCPTDAPCNEESSANPYCGG